jgi:DNA repair exonuclease SbcCD ATPase subunit
VKILSLNVINFKRLRGRHYWEFPDGIIGITGSNGQGKSTIASAIAWALFGPDMLPNGKADVVSWGTTPHAVVQVLFEINSKRYRVSRKQNNTNTSDAELVLESDDPAWPPQFLTRGIDPTNREVEKLLGVDRVGFLTSVYARQKELDGLMSQTPANRVKTMLRLLGIEQLTSAIETVRAEARDGRKKADYLRNENQVSPDSYKSMMELQEGKIRETQEKVEVAKKKLTLIEQEKTDLVNKLSALIPQQQALEQYSERINKSEAAFSAADAELRAAERAYEALAPTKAPGPEPEPVDESDVHAAELALVEVRQERIDIRNKVDAIKKNSKCFACDRPFDHAADLETQLQQLLARDDVLQGQDEDLYAELSILKHDRTRHLQWRADSAIWGRWLQAHVAALERIERARYVLAGEAEHRERLRAAMPSIQGSENISTLQEKRLNTEIAAGQIRESLATLAGTEENWRLNFEVSTNNYKRAVDIQDKIKEISNRALNHDVAAAELSALKEKMIGSVIPMLTERASALVSKFTDGRYTELSLTSDYEIQYRNELGELKGFNNLSGGEKNVFALALRLAISDLRADSIGVLILDEVLDAMDADRQESTWSTLERLTNRYHQVFLITHVQEFKDRAPTVINL